ncbi:tRNA (guanine-N7-)-methyltransferase [Sporomusaceae bacterium BoRhaA]|uniref:tRNA (guanosine(46)-N7)-methyltransferase TrmB n=1 Tax=Pelorhabdus rhamnosifermentans TaxID=2772457 RepID=UPI001C060ADA|nr:tRNA (guanosine(46)-N7)-methyltransferase TrmB [Pelorhabdus rhamnosifermentans]MBU2700560.1 tRNA (guanine-N7-)-methyltransferase [Pelorhabdus rhamnosifermentans]
MRLRRRPWIATAIQDYSDFIVNLNESLVKPDWEALFGRKASLYVELGTGKGQFITELARQNPDRNYVGVEAQHDIIFYAARKAQEKELANVKFLLMDANQLTEMFQVNSVMGLFINFCDPWPKKRHAKRRLTFHGFFDNYRQVLEKNGLLSFKTDNRDLFEFSLNEFVNANVRLQNISLDLHESNMIGNVMTEYETKFSSMGQPIYRLEAVFS